MPPPCRASCQDGFRKRTLRLSLVAVRFATANAALGRVMYRSRWARPDNTNRKEPNMTKPNNDTTASKKPTHFAYQIREREGGKGFWTKIGAAWSHSDGAGFTIQIDAVPLDGRITLRVATEKKD
jgi:hypothetical protein